MKKIGLLFLLFGMVININCQSSFDITINKPKSDYAFSSIEKENEYYTTGLFRDSTASAIGAIIKYDNNNNLFIKDIQKQDTQVIINYSLAKYNGNILTIGSSYNISQFNHLYISEFTSELETVEEDYYNLVPDSYDYINLHDMAFNHDNHIILVGHCENYGGGSINNIFLIELDMEGNILNSNYEESVFYDCTPFSDLIVKNDSTGYYYFNAESYEIVEFNNDLEYVDGNYYVDWPHKIGGTVTAKYLSNGSLLFVCMTNNSNNFYDLQLMIFDNELNFVRDTILVEDGRQYPARLKGIDFISEENIWVAVHDSWISPTGTEIYKIYIFDSELNVKGVKYYGGDTQYDFNYLTATSDGGCIITGTCSEEEGSMDQDIFIKKVMPFDILTNDDEIIFSEFKDVMIYPNPVSDKIYLKTDRENLNFILYKINGEMVHSSVIMDHHQNEINISYLPKGYYIYSISNAKGKAIDGGKILKK